MATLLSLILVCIQAPQGPALQPAAAPIPWRKTADEAIGEARRTGKLAALVFRADWCYYSRKLETETLPDAEVVKLFERFVPCRQGYDRDRPQTRRFRVMEIPQVVFVDGDGRVVERLIGQFAPADYVREFRRRIEFLYDKPELEKRLAQNPNDAEALARLAVIHAERKEYEAARPLLDRAEAADAKDEPGLRTRAYRAFAEQAKEARQADEMVVWLTKALSGVKEPADEVQVRLDLAEAYFRGLQQYDKAREHLSAIIANPLAPEDKRTRATRYLDHMNEKEAEALAGPKPPATQPATEPAAPATQPAGRE